MKIRLILAMLFPMILLIAVSDQDEFGLEVTKYTPGGSVEWKNIYEDAKGETVLVDRNDDIIISGLYKLDGEGNVVWRHDIAHYNLILDAENNLYLDNFYFDLVKIDENGSVQWSHKYENLYVNILQVDQENNVLLLASNEIDYETINSYLVKYNSQGEMLWKKSFSYEQFHPGYIQQFVGTDIEKSIIVIGMNGDDEYNYLNTFISKLNQSGNTIWANYYDYLYANAIVTKTGESILDLGTTIFCVDANGSELWSVAFSESTNHLLAPQDINIDNQGNIVSLYIEPWRDTYDNEVFVVKYSPDGEELWSASLNRASDNMYNLRIDADDNIIIGGTSCTWHDCQCMTVKYTAQGAKKWTKFNRTGYGEESCGLDVDSEGHVIVGALLGVKYEKEEDDDEPGCGCF